MNQERRPTDGVPRRIAARGDQRARGAEWAVVLAAAALLLVSVGGYLYHRDQLASIAVEHLRLRVCLPPSLGPGRPAEFHVLTTGLTGEPAVALVEIGLLAPDGAPILHLNDQTDADGRLRVVIPAQDALPGQGVQIEVTAGRNGARATFETRLAVEPARYRTCLATDRPGYRPGHTVFYRSVTLSNWDLAEAPDETVEFEFQDAAGRPVPESALAVRTSHGVGRGAFTLPADFPAGEVALVARSPNRRFPEVRLPVTIDLADIAPDAADADAASADEFQVEFFPESGFLVPNLDNRVYFAARDARGEPVDVRGLLVDADDTPVAVVEAMRGGRGAFSFRPRAGGTYRLKIGEPSGVEFEPELPKVDPRHNVVLSAGVGVFGAGKPLELNLRAAEDGVPLVVTARCRGILVAQKPIVTRVVGDGEPQEGVQGAGGVNQVSLDVPESVSGLIRLAVYDYRTSPPVPVAQRWVYRRPAGHLALSAVSDVQPSASGRRATVRIAVSDESGNPAPAILAVTAVDRAMTGPADDRAASLPDCFLFDSRRPAQAKLDAVGDVEGDVALDLLLGTHAHSAVTAPQEAEDQPLHPLGSEAGAPPVVFDNLLPLRQKYADALAGYRRDRTRALNTLTTLSFFGGFGLVLAVAMLGLLGVVSGLRLWIPAGGTAICCLLIGAILLAPLRHGTGPEGAAAYLSFLEPVFDNEAAPDDEPLADDASPDGPAPPQLEYDREAAAPADWSESAGTLLWNPLLAVDNSGQVEVQFDLPDGTDDICLRLEAHGGGRLAEVRTCPGNADAIY